MSEETNNPGRLDAQAYKADSVNETSPTSSHHEFERGVRAELLVSQQEILDELNNNIIPLLPFIPTSDQKDAMDNANNPDATNPFATIQDLANQANSTQTSYTFRTATDAPADEEIKLNNADPTLATIVRIANINRHGLNQSNILLLLGDSDAVVIGDNNEANKVYNYDVTGDPTQVAGSGSGGYVEVPVAFFAQGPGGNIADAEEAELCCYSARQEHSAAL